MEGATTGTALGTPEIRDQIEALRVGQSIEFKFDNGGRCLHVGQWC
jgi:hypothetical protein